MIIRHTFLIIIILIAIAASSQDTTYTFFDVEWQKTLNKNYVYYRKLFKAGKKKWVTQDYYRNGNLQMTGIYKSKRAKKENGVFTYYYENGQKKAEYIYVIGKKEGPCSRWYNDGTNDFTGFYSNDKMNGEWIWYFNKGIMSAREFYIYDSLKTYSFWNEDGSEADYEQAMRKPYFIGGHDALIQYLDENTNYPMKARIGGFQGEVLVSFIINRQGKIEDVKVVEPNQHWLDKEAVRVVESMPDWMPGFQHNRLERFLFRLPILFKLN